VRRFDFQLFDECTISNYRILPLLTTADLSTSRGVIRGVIKSYGIKRSRPDYFANNFSNL